MAHTDNEHCDHRLVCVDYLSVWRVCVLGRPVWQQGAPQSRRIQQTSRAVLQLLQDCTDMTSMNSTLGNTMGTTAVTFHSSQTSGVPLSKVHKEVRNTTSKQHDEASSENLELRRIFVP